VQSVLIEPGEPQHRLVLVVCGFILAADRQQQERGVLGAYRRAVSVTKIPSPAWECRPGWRSSYRASASA
jgi:hypothetical protein